MATKAELLAEAKELGLEFTEGATVAQIQKAIDAKLAAAPDEDVTPAGDGETSTEEQETAEEKAAREAREKAAEEARIQEEKEQAEAEAEQKRLEAEAKARKEDRSQGSEIASAIVEGLKATKEDKRIRIKSDRSVVSRYSIVRNKQTGEVMIRENETGLLSKVQLESLEEKEASLQNQEVEEL